MENNRKIIKYARIINVINQMWVLLNFVLYWIFRGAPELFIFYITGSILLVSLSLFVFFSLEKEKVVGRYWFIATPIATCLFAAFGSTIGIVTIILSLRFTEQLSKQDASLHLESMIQNKDATLKNSQLEETMNGIEKIEWSEFSNLPKQHKGLIFPKYVEGVYCIDEPAFKVEEALDIFFYQQEVEKSNFGTVVKLKRSLELPLSFLTIEYSYKLYQLADSKTGIYYRYKVWWRLVVFICWLVTTILMLLFAALLILGIIGGNLGMIAGLPVPIGFLGFLCYIAWTTKAGKQQKKMEKIFLEELANTASKM